MATFEEKASRMREHGSVRVTDTFPGDGRRPYRYAQLTVVTDRASAAAVAARMADLAIEIDGCFSFWTHYHDGMHFCVSIDRELSDEEIGDPPCAHREVTP